MQASVAMLRRPIEGGDQAAILRDIVGRDTDPRVELSKRLTVVIRDDGTIARGARVAAGTTVDMRRNHQDSES